MYCDNDGPRLNANSDETSESGDPPDKCCSGEIRNTWFLPGDIEEATVVVVFLAAPIILVDERLESDSEFRGILLLSVVVVRFEFHDSRRRRLLALCTSWTMIPSFESLRSLNRTLRDFCFPIKKTTTTTTTEKLLNKLNKFAFLCIQKLIGVSIRYTFLYFHMVKLQKAEKPIIAIIDTMLMSRQNLRLTIQFLSQGMG